MAVNDYYTTGTAMGNANIYYNGVYIHSTGQNGLYTLDENGNIVEYTPSHTHATYVDGGSWSFYPKWEEQEYVIHGKGEERMKFSDSVMIKIGDEWVDVVEQIKYIQILEEKIKRIMAVMPEWQRKEMSHIEEEEIDEYDEFIDSKLFKV